MNILLTVIITTHGEPYEIKNVSEYNLFKNVNDNRIEIIITEDKINKEPEYIKELQNKGLNIKWFFSDKDGVANNRNNGLKHATGKYITLIDSPNDLIFDKKLYNILSNDYDIINFDGYSEPYYINGIYQFNDAFWGKFYKLSLFEHIGYFEFIWNGWHEEDPSASLFNLKLKTYKIKFKDIRNKHLVKHIIQEDGAHISRVFPTPEHCMLYLDKAKNNHELYLMRASSLINMIENAHDCYYKFNVINDERYINIVKHCKEILK